MKQLRITNKQRFQDHVVLPLLSIGATIAIWYVLYTPQHRELATSLITTFINKLI